jgi:AraC-like DNA-binding protein
MAVDSGFPSAHQFNKPLMGGAIDWGAGKFCLDDPSNTLFEYKADRDEVCALVGGIFKPHSLQVVGMQPLQAQMRHVPFGGLSLSRLSYGAAVQISPVQLKNFFLVTMPLWGGATMQTAGKSVDAHPELAAVLNPFDEIRMSWTPDHEQVILKISRSLLEQTLAGYLGQSLELPLVFDLGFRWQDHAPWRTLMCHLLACATHYPDIERHPLILTQLEQMTASALLQMHRHNYSDSPSKRRVTVLPRHVRRAQEFLQTHAHEPVTTLLLAQITGVSTRSLNDGFKQFLETSPMQYLREVRLAKVRAELLLGIGDTVASVALRWGFEHMGRFASEYRKKYGESPSKTLRR